MTLDSPRGRSQCVINIRSMIPDIDWYHALHVLLGGFPIYIRSIQNAALAPALGPYFSSSSVSLSEKHKPSPCLEASSSPSQQPHSSVSLGSHFSCEDGFACGSSRRLEWTTNGWWWHKCEFQLFFFFIYWLHSDDNRFFTQSSLQWPFSELTTALGNILTPSQMKIRCSPLK